MTWLYYLLEANLYLLIFYAFYRLFLHQETFYNSNRYFLLSSSLIAFMLPILQVGKIKPLPLVETVNFNSSQFYFRKDLTTSTLPLPSTNDFNDYLYLFYLLVVFCFVIKLSLGLYKIISLCLKAKKTKSGKVTLVEIKDETSAFSFFNLLFIHPHLAKKQTVLKHEMVHIKQGHSFDILFFELIQIVCWFNPITYFIKNDIKLLHEYIADELTTNNDVHKHEYALFLIQNSFGINRQPIANQFFNQSILKRRINMLNKKRTAARARLRLLLIVPLVAVMLCTSTLAFTKDYGYVDLLPEKSKFTLNQTKPKAEDIKRSETPKAQDIKRQAKDQVNPSPSVIQEMKGKFYPFYSRDKTSGKILLKEKRYILINGIPVKDLTTFYGVSNADHITYLNNIKAAVAKYGEKARYGAVVITGKNINYFTKKTFRTPPFVEPPPPIVKPAGKKPKSATALKTPPPPVEKNGNVSATHLKKVTIYADPAPSKKTDTIKVILGDPIKTPELKSVKQ